MFMVQRLKEIKNLINKLDVNKNVCAIRNEEIKMYGKKQVSNKNKQIRLKTKKKCTHVCIILIESIVVLD